MDAYLGEIRAVSFNFAPRYWAMCNGQLLSVQSNQSLFAILGTAYGGDGRSTFALPDLRGRSLVSAPGGTPGISGGSATVTLSQQNLPLHNHTATFAATAGTAPGLTVNISATAAPGQQNPPSGPNYIGGEAAGAGNSGTYATALSGSGALAGTTVAFPAMTPTVTVNNTGSSAPFNIVPPYLALNYIICLNGIFPSRN